VLRDLATEQTLAIRIDSRLQYEQLKAFGMAYTPASAAKLEHYRGERPIFDLFNVEEEIARALGRRVDLKSGGYLIIDQTEALTTIDVNTGGFVGARNFDDTIFKTNLEAAPSPASCGCATWAASSSSTSSTWRARSTSRPCWPSCASSSRATAPRPR
jgi:ribonuclease G